MKFTVTKIYKATKASHPIVTGILLLLLLPFIVLAVVGILIWHLPLLFKRLFTKQPKQKDSLKPKVKVITNLIERENITIQLMEDNTDNEYTAMVELWYAQVYDEDVYPYRAVTEPLIAGLSNAFITDFIKEIATGAFIQIIDVDKTEKEPVIGSRLVFLHYDNLTIETIEPVGPYLLYIDKRKPDLIMGLNYNGSIELSVTQTGN